MNQRLTIRRQETGNARASSTQRADVELCGAVQAFSASLRAGGLSEATIRSYLTACDLFARYVGARHRATELRQISTEHIEEFISHLLERHSAATAANRYRSLRIFFRFCAGRGLLDSSPMTGMRAPRVPLKEVPVLDREKISRLLATCEQRRDFLETRDYAVLRLFVTTGARRSEVANLSTEAIDFDEETVGILGKGSKERVVSLDARTVESIKLYVALRSRLPGANRPELWLSADGTPLSGWGVDQLARRRAAQAGISGFHLHLLRHSFADMALANGMSEGDLMRVAGWSSRSMLDRYGRANAQRRANAAHTKLIDRIGI